jgi:hypothetical protein
MATDWYYSTSEGQAGPITDEEFRKLLASGSVSRQTLVWQEGMADWLPAENLTELFASSTQPATDTSDNPYAVSQAATGRAPSGKSYPPFLVKKASFKLHLILQLIIPAIIFVVMFIAMAGAGASASVSPDGEPSDAVAATLGASFMLLVAVLYGCLIAGSIVGLVHLYRAWYCLQPGGARATPGQAVGFLFIPFFNLYWYFIAYKGLADDWNRIMDSYEDLHGAPRFESGIFLAFAICYLIFPPLAVVFYFMAHHQICKGINFMAARPRESHGVQLY